MAILLSFLLFLIYQLHSIKIEVFLKKQEVLKELILNQVIWLFY